jgi:hypothetical protein
MTLAPIVLFTYNRPDHTSEAIRSLAANKEASKSDLIVFSDGPKSDADIQNVNSTRKILQSISGFKSVKVFESEKNKGLANSVIEGVSKVIEQYDKVIVLEDDLVVLPEFLSYMNHFLEVYKNEDKVISIHGYVYPVKTNVSTPFFIRGADCWGWATWKRGWDMFEADSEKLYKQIATNKKRADKFDFEGTYPFLKMLKDQADGKIDSWAIRWYASAFLNDKITLYPPATLVNNIGMDGSGIHSEKNTMFAREADNLRDIQLHKKPDRKVESRKMVLGFQEFFRTLKPSLIKRLINRIKR